MSRQECTTVSAILGLIWKLSSFGMFAVIKGATEQRSNWANNGREQQTSLCVLEFDIHVEIGIRKIVIDSNAYGMQSIKSSTIGCLFPMDFPAENTVNPAAS